MSDPTTPIAIAAKYDAIAYDALPQPVTHPDHIAAVVTMFGLHPPPVATARVLEVGCNDGANLLPMAAGLPQARFVGCDIASGAIRAAREAAGTLGLSNVRFLEADLATLDEGAFDYIVAHGVYSWVPPEVRDALLALASRALAPRGILFVSYNTYPGSYLRRAAWEALRWHTRDLPEAGARIAAARELAAMLGDSGPSRDAADAALQAEFRRASAESDSALFHDTLAEPNDPVWFHAFAAHAERHGLTFVAEALPSMMAGGGLAHAVRELLAAQERLAREQMLDLARARRFRQSLLCRSADDADVALSPHRIGSLHASASLALQRAAAEGRLPTTPGPDGAMLAALLERLLATTPMATPVADLIARFPASERGARQPDAVLLDAWAAGFAELHTHPPRVASTTPEKPRAAAVARWQAVRRDRVTNLRHETVRLPDAFARTLLPLCDGSRDRLQLAQAVAHADPASGESLLAHVDDSLAGFARHGLLALD